MLKNPPSNCNGFCRLPSYFFILALWISVGLGNSFADESKPLSFTGAEWIWYPEGDPAVHALQGTRWFRKTFEVPADSTVKSAFLVSTCDDSLEIFVNGKMAATRSDWQKPGTDDITSFLHPGSNVIAIAGTNGTPGPTGLLARLRITLTDGREVSVGTDATWLTSNEAVSDWLLPTGGTGWKAALSMYPAGEGPWGIQPWMNLAANDAIPDDFVRIEVPGLEKEMELWRELYWHYYKTAPLTGTATIWDALMPVPMLTIATSSGNRLTRTRAAWRKTLAEKRYLDEEGYVSQDQHTSIAHPLGWPFPTWVVMPDGTYIAGKTTGWHFFNRARGAIWPWLFPAFEAQHRMADTAIEGWELHDLESLGGAPDGRWKLRVTGPNPSLTAPAHGLPIEAFCSPFLQIRHLAPKGMPKEAKIAVQWSGADSKFDVSREVPVSAKGHNPWVSEGGDELCLAPMYKHKDWTGIISGLKFLFQGFPQDTVLQIDSIFTTFDTRTAASNGAFLLGSTDYFRLTGDLEFLKVRLADMRKALRYAREQMGADKHGLINPEWVGQDARPGYLRNEAGEYIPQIGHGVGMDIIPYGHDDLYSTNFYFGGLSGMIELEEAIALHPEWKLSPPDPGQDAAALRVHAAKVRSSVHKKLFNPTTGRYGGSRDDLGTLRDYGHTMVNMDAVYYGLAESDDARSVMDWLDGRRIIETDTAKGPDIYHWEFAPRFGTLKNSDWWIWLWRGHEHAYNDQCQDGGTWFSISAQDIVNRAKILGPDNAWKRVSEILAWYGRVKEAGGFRSYYKDPAKGTLQGGGTAGSLGLDNEFVENVRAPYALIEAIIGFRPLPDGLEIKPRLPSSWPSAKVSGLAFRDQVIDLELSADTITLHPRGGTSQPARIVVPEGFSGPQNPVTLTGGTPVTFTRQSL